MAFNARNNAKKQVYNKLDNATKLEPMPDCCTYEQVYSRIIELLNKTSGAGNLESADLSLSRAILEELEVSYF